MGREGREEVGWPLGVTGFTLGEAGMASPRRGAREAPPARGPPRAGRRRGAGDDIVGIGLGIERAGTRPAGVGADRAGT